MAAVSNISPNGFTITFTFIAPSSPTTTATAFYDFYFSKPNERASRFLDQFDPGKPGLAAELGATLWLMDRVTGADLNHAMREAAGPYIARLRFQFSSAEKESDLAIAALLAAKHGKSLSDLSCSGQTEPAPMERSCPALGEESTGEQLSMFSAKD